MNAPARAAVLVEHGHLAPPLPRLPARDSGASPLPDPHESVSEHGEVPQWPAEDLDAIRRCRTDLPILKAVLLGLRDLD